MTDVTLALASLMSRTAIGGKLWSMGRWEPDGRRRMQEAALALFGERGFERTTAAEVAERAGLTERTFFRHFPDKREVLFADNDLRDRIAAAVASVDGTAPIEAVAAGLDAVADVLQGRREAVTRRARIIAEHPELQERELMKLASWSDALEGALLGRGLSGPAAKLLAEVSIAVFRAAYGRWLDEGPERELSETIHETLAELGGFFGDAAQAPQSLLPAPAGATARRGDG